MEFFRPITDSKPRLYALGAGALLEEVQNEVPALLSGSQALLLPWLPG